MCVANVPALKCICFKNSEKNQKSLKKVEKSFLVLCTCFCIFRLFLVFDSQFDITDTAKAKLVLTFSASDEKYVFAHANTPFHRKELILCDLKSNTYFIPYVFLHYSFQLKHTEFCFCPKFLFVITVSLIT